MSFCSIEKEKLMPLLNVPNKYIFHIDIQPFLAQYIGQGQQQ